MERLTGMIEGLERASFAQLEEGQRVHAIEELWRNLERGRKLGREALYALEVHVPMTVMKRALAAA
jgi:hypothetical protein